MCVILCMQLISHVCHLQNWEFDDKGYMVKRYASINDLAIQEADRKFRWER